MPPPAPAPGPEPRSVAGVYGWPDRRNTVLATRDGITVDAARAARIGPRSYLMDPADPESVLTFSPEPEPAVLYWLVWPMPRIS